MSHPGSSPHTRGARQAILPVSSLARIIPAYAGSTKSLDMSKNSSHGSSPHTRGARLASECRQSGIGIIPAYAGSTDAAAVAIEAPPDHPRIRGEHLCAGGRCTCGRGSSPHTRGALRAVHLPTRAPGIIPAYAGSTDPPRGRSYRRWDHPRIRGEHSIELSPLLGVEGSSPHTRGAPSLRPLHWRWAGIIPAYAGSTARRFQRGASAGDHPRIRGEHDPNRSFGEKMAGSSPHTRGAHGGGGAVGDGVRIIPAYAGSTRRDASPDPSETDHPRIRGEHRLKRARGFVHEGSSPHTRGAPIRPGAVPTGGGIIPAYAGSTCRRSTGPGRRWDHPRIRGEHRRRGPTRQC